MKRRLTVTLLCLLAGLYAVDRLGGLLMEQVAHHTRDVLGPKLCDLERGLDADVVLIGASRCHHHYVPSILSGSLGLSVYNAGVGGSDNIFSHCLVLRHVLSRHVPRVVCLELMTADFAPEATPFLALSFFAPRRVARPIRTMVWSSAIKTRIFCFMGYGFLGHLGHLGRMGHLGRFQPDGDRGFCALAGGAVEDKVAFKSVDAVADALKTEMSLADTRRGLRIEAAAVVGNGEE